jgi:hypothetical protein
MCLYVLSSCYDFSYDLRIQMMFGSSLHSFVCKKGRGDSCLIYVIGVCVRIVVSKHILCFVLFFSSCCQFLWIVHFLFLQDEDKNTTIAQH